MLFESEIMFYVYMHEVKEEKAERKVIQEKEKLLISSEEIEEEREVCDDSPAV
ncbi:hypothetical protein E1A91_D10G126300v1 [Gossypium mustelinum]|uniref:Uncharacterized protein n=1 Tax=Gossypium mustelinum TaxID=34275 RepID=A0A5D2T6L3_GOSMU|nr:hypothetical protein E1A91_D10G126300v1 [Gossypium mustelinum]